MYHRTSRKEKRIKRKASIVAKIRGTARRPRMSVFRSNRFMSVQLIDDTKGTTLLYLKGSGKNTKEAKALGSKIAKQAMRHGMKTVVFDRGGFRYHGSVKALADAAREGGLTF
ncbi:50S ribosomal protein L18 [Candidatus Gottesmanbacteria bacterium]|nr:50S ribosomal protein L18 [Candidatus Gottesmanbacteria bacterium]